MKATVVDAAASRAALLSFSAVRKEFQRAGVEPLLAIDEVTFDLRPGEFVTVVGPSGCGKTTLLRMVAGMTKPTGGAVTFADENDTSSGFVFQHASLFPWSTVQQNVAFGLELATHRRRVKLPAGPAEHVARLLQLVGLGDFAKSFPAEISGGMQQRCNLARALAIEPKLLLMDEPFSSLDAQTREELQLQLQLLTVKLGTSVLFITHDIREAAFLSDRVVVLSPRPSKVLDIVEIATPRPRTLEFQVSPEFNAVMKRLFDLIYHVGDAAE